jgi:heme oxygenase
MISPLSVLLREGTRDSHRLAENTLFIRQFFAGQLSLESYRIFLVQLRHIYSALEQTQELHKGHAAYQKVYFPSLYRTAALEEDLSFYFRDERWQEMPPYNATSDYVQRISSLSGEWVEGLVAHHYTRYLGDLSGGQVLKRIVAKTFHLDSSAGLAFYEFPQIPDHKAFKEEYRSRLDSMELEDATLQAIVQEANHAFALNRGVFEAMLEPAR